MGSRIFVSYRRDDDPAAAARVRDGLARLFGKTSIFMDVDDLLAGLRFDEELAKALADCDVFVAIIGARWMDLLNEKAANRERDYVREEIAEALKRKIVVIPVRVGRDGKLPPLPLAQALQADIRDVVMYQKHDVTHEHYGRDIGALGDAIVAVRKRLQPKRAGVGKVWVGLGIAGLIALTAVGAVMLSVVAPPRTTEVPPVQSDAERERAAYSAAHLSDSVVGWEGFLQAWPASANAQAARERLAMLRRGQSDLTLPSDCSQSMAFTCLKRGSIRGLTAAALQNVSCPEERLATSDNMNWKDIWTTSVYSYAPGSTEKRGGGQENDMLRVGGWGDWYFALMKFDTPKVSSQLSFVALLLYTIDDSGSSGELYLDRITQDWGWKPGDRLWWADKPSAVTLRKLTAPERGKWFAIDITDVINEWKAGKAQNFGLQLRPVSNDNKYSTFFSSRAADHDKRPRLLICR